ncbi:NfrA family protein [Burkholderia sp. Leaf177]|uniref:NfrA family protein n=1 Tax=Burkholderia sp. Leaf177 TaxID=1736287 RepID=UPI0012E37F91|nr:tetratricopeptide repeat protein [Burkholderia sp. Leaf177]
MTGSAYKVARQAYGSYDSHRYQASVGYAREAIRQRPDVISLRLLLASALEAQGDRRGAVRAIDAAIRDLGPDPSLRARRSALLAIIAGGGNGRADPNALTGELAKTAERAYRAYAKHEYENAMTSANEVLAVRPDVMPLQLLVIDALTAEGRDLDAYNAVIAETQRSGDNEGLRARRGFIGARLGPVAASEAYDALKRGDTQTAIERARAAIGYAPDVPGARELLIDALMQANRFDEAEQAATDAISANPSALTPMLLRGAIRERLGRHEASRADFSEALRLQDETQQESRNGRIVIADMALATGDPQRALDALNGLEPNGDATDLMINVRRQKARRALSSSVAATGSGDLPLPLLDCVRIDSGILCTLHPFDPAYAQYAAAARAYDQHDYALAVVQAREAVRIAPDDPVHRLLLIQALASNGDEAESRQEASNLIQSGMIDVLPSVNAAYFASNAGQPALAARYYNEADRNQELPPSSLLDAGYANLNAGATPEAAGYFRRGIDANNNGDISLPPQQAYETRRTMSEVDRTWGVNASVGYRPTGDQTTFVASPGSTGDKSVQAGAEAYWRPFGYLDGHIVELYARAYETLYSKAGNTTGTPSLEGALGVRARPFASQNLVFAFERIVPLGSAVQPDWLGRIAYSNGFGTDLRVDTPSWWTGQLYAEGGHYVTHPDNYATFTGELGRSYRLDAIDPHLVAFPYAVLGGDYNTQINNRASMGAGVGLNLRYWFREDTYHAPRSFVDFSLQYRLKIVGDDRAKGVFFNASFSY